MTEQSGVYMIRNTVSGSVYIGSSTDVQLRWQQHQWDCARGRHFVKPLQWDWQRYGPSSFVFELLESVDRCIDFTLPTMERVEQQHQRRLDLRHVEQRWLNQIHPDVTYNRQPAMTWPCCCGLGPCSSSFEVLNQWL